MVFHGECESDVVGVQVEASCAVEALRAANPIFRYYEGDCNQWSSVPLGKTRVKETHRAVSGLVRDELVFEASVDGSPDYFLIYAYDTKAAMFERAKKFVTLKNKLGQSVDSTPPFRWFEYSIGTAFQHEPAITVRYRTDTGEAHVECGEAIEARDVEAANLAEQMSEAWALASRILRHHLKGDAAARDLFRQ
jgi:hypothetical protein